MRPLVHHQSWSLSFSVMWQTVVWSPTSIWVQRYNLPVPLCSLCLLLLNQSDGEAHSEKCLKGADRCLFSQVQSPWSFLSLVSFSFVVFGQCIVFVCSLNVGNYCFCFLETSHAPHKFFWLQMAATGFCLILKHFSIQKSCIFNYCCGYFHSSITVTTMVSGCSAPLLLFRGYFISILCLLWIAIKSLITTQSTFTRDVHHLAS